MGISVILLAGGIGSRMGSEVPKQYHKLNEKPLALHSFDQFKQMKEIDEIVVVCEPQYQELFNTERFALPGVRRQDSVYNGLQKASQELILIHDAARPFIDREMIQRVIAAGTKHSAATVGMPVKFTVKEKDTANFVVNTPNRDQLWEIQTPQIIRRDLLVTGFQKAIEENLTVTDDVSLVEIQNLPVKLVEGNYMNIKVTTPEDLEIAKMLMRDHV